ncbi:MAG: sensor histidine kinase [Desulfobulbaceae bacterium]|nr:sensor histidine kinase [Desulfobulbaceae bacterium]
MTLFLPKKTIIPLFALIVAGVVGNFVGASFPIGMEFLFGGIFAMLALQLLGQWPGLIAALAISSAFIFVRQQPFDITLLTLELAVVGWLFRQKGFGLVVADALYWLIVGMPLAYLFYRSLDHAYTDIASILMFKQAINGITNALLARLIFMVSHSRSRTIFFPLREVVFSLSAMFVLFPSLALMIFGHREAVKELETSVRQAVQQSSQGITGSLELWLELKSARLSHLAWLARQDFPALQHDLDFVCSLDPDVEAVGIIDKNAISTAFSPQRDELGQATIGKDFSDRPYLKELKRSLRPQLSDVVISKFGKPEPIVVMAAPIVQDGVYDGYVAAILNLGRVQKILSSQGGKQGLRCTLLDRNNRVIATNRDNLQVMGNFSSSPGMLLPVAGALGQWHPQVVASSAILASWQNSIFVMEQKGTLLGEWRLIVEQPMGHFAGVFYELYAEQVELVFVVLLIAFVIAEIFSRKVLVSVVSLQEITSELPEKLGGVHAIRWPTSFIREVDTVIHNFMVMSTLLVKKFSEIKQLNLTLEHRVDVRTKELEDMTVNLAVKVEEEMARRRKNEQILIQQAKLASMGEMLGAIAHQWRQPLNSLGLCIQNIKDSYSFGELSEEYLDRTVQESMLQISHMSRTIDDFRDFFQPDKEKTLFDAMVTVGEVLSLFSSQLSSYKISVVLTCHTHQKTFDKIEDIVACSAKITLGYKNEFEHVILNLINNARDAIVERRERGLLPASEQGRISFDFRRTEREVEIRITDNGGGVPEQIVERIFEPYFTTKDPDKGTGIGLYLAKVIIEDHLQGKISVHNVEQGASFVLVLPVVEEGLDSLRGEG